MFATEPEIKYLGRAWRVFFVFFFPRKCFSINRLSVLPTEWYFPLTPRAAPHANPVRLKGFDGEPGPIAICSQIVNQVWLNVRSFITRWGTVSERSGGGLRISPSGEDAAFRREPPADLGADGWVRSLFRTYRELQGNVKWVSIKACRSQRRRSDPDKGFNPGFQPRWTSSSRLWWWRRGGDTVKN